MEDFQQLAILLTINSFTLFSFKKDIVLKVIYIFFQTFIRQFNFQDLNSLDLSASSQLLDNTP